MARYIKKLNVSEVCPYCLVEGFTVFNKDLAQPSFHIFPRRFHCNNCFKDFCWPKTLREETLISGNVE